jgi:hypothetical protein
VGLASGLARVSALAGGISSAAITACRGGTIGVAAHCNVQRSVGNLRCLWIEDERDT